MRRVSQEDLSVDQVLRQRRRRTTAALYVQSARLETLIGPLPADDKVIKIVSLANLSAAGFLRYVADRTTIRELIVSTYRIGPNTLRQLRRLRELGHLDRATFIVGRLMSKDKRKASAIQYWEDLSDLCQRHGWECVSLDNHTKLALFDTAAGKFVLEGSCNLNEAPNYEQFSFSRDEELYDFYAAALKEMRQLRNGGAV